MMPWERYIAPQAAGPWAKYGAADMHDLDPTRSLGENIAAGGGKGLYDIARGAGQRVGILSQQEVDDAKALDAPLHETAGGKVGEVVGAALPFAAASMIPGVNTVPGSIATGTVMGLLKPTSENESALVNASIGGVTGGLTKWGLDKLGSAFASRAASKATEAGELQAQNAVRDAALAAGKKAGYVVPPSTINPTMINQGVESLGGKIATAQEASVANQKVTDTLAREALGLKKGSLLTEGKLADMRKIAGQAYQAIKDVGGKFKADDDFNAAVSAIGQDFSTAAREFPESTRNAAIEALNKDLQVGNANFHQGWSPTAILEKVKLLRSDASSNFKAFDDPAKLALARAQRQAADALDGLLERSLAGNGMGNLSQSYKAARVLIAKSHDVEAALMPDGHINAQVLARIGDKGFLSDQLKTIAEFSGSFPKAVQPISKVGSPAITTLRTGTGAAIGTVMGGPVGTAVGTAVGYGGPWSIRKLLLSGAGQSLMASPRYGAGSSARISDLLSAPLTRRMLPAMAPAAALDYGFQQ